MERTLKQKSERVAELVALLPQGGKEAKIAAAAELLEVSPRTIRNYINGTTEPSIIQIQALAKVAKA